MEWIGKFTGANRSLDGKRLLLTFEVDPVTESQLEELKKQEQLSLRAIKFRKKRSLDANAYAWVLMSKIAEATKSSKEEIYEEMLQRYGSYYQDESGYIVGTFPIHVDISKIEGHWKRYKENGKFVSYLMLKGSSHYDTSEMSRFIDHILEEAKELGIETMPPEELRRMKQEWNIEG